MALTSICPPTCREPGSVNEEDTNGYTNEVCPACLHDQTKQTYEIDGYVLDTCRQCDHLYVRNSPSAEMLAEYYSGHYALDVGVKSRRLNRRLKYWAFSKYLQTLSKSDKISLLEIGCNEGDLLTAVQNNPRFDAEGIDFSQPAIDYACSKGLKTRLGDLVDMNYDESTFDIVVAIHVVEHMQAPATTLLDILRILKPGGHFFAVMPCSSHVKARRAGRQWKYLNPPHHLWYFTPRSLRAMLERLGFEVRMASCLYHRAHVRVLARKSAA